MRLSEEDMVIKRQKSSPRKPANGNESSMEIIDVEEAVEGGADEEAADGTLASVCENVNDNVERYKRRLKKNCGDVSFITNPIQTKVNDVQSRAWSGNKDESRTVVLGGNNKGKSFLLDTILRAG